MKIRKLVGVLLALVVMVSGGGLFYHLTRPATGASVHRAAASPKHTKQAAKPRATATTPRRTLTTRQKVRLTRQIKHDMRGVGGRWSVQVTRLTQPTVTLKTGNHTVKRQRAASTIKLYIMLTIFQQHQQGKLPLTATTRQALRRMIYNSDNAAANQLIATAGGLKSVNRVIRQHHFTQTVLGRHLMDTRALQRGHDNWTSVRDLSRFLTLLSQHRLLGKTADRQMLALLHHCRNHSKLPLRVTHAQVYNKTGEYPDLGVQNDAALFKTTSSQKIVIVVLSQGSRATRQYPAMNRLGRDLVHRLR